MLLKFLQTFYKLLQLLIICSYISIFLYFIPKAESITEIILFLLIAFLIHIANWLLATLSYIRVLPEIIEPTNPNNIQKQILEQEAKINSLLIDLDNLQEVFLSNSLWQHNDFPQTKNQQIIKLQTDWENYSKNILKLNEIIKSLQKLSLQSFKRKNLKQALNVLINRLIIHCWASFSKTYISISKHPYADRFLEDFQSYQVVINHFFTAREILLLVKAHPKFNSSLSEASRKQYKEISHNLHQLKTVDLANNTRKLVKNTTKQTVFPIQKKLSQIIGKLKIPIRKNRLINQNNLEQTLIDLQPLDILVLRNNWEVSNMFLPGFWTHSLIYLGNLELLNELTKDRKSKRYLQKQYQNQNLEEILKEKFPSAYNKLQNNQNSYLDATSEGVEVHSYQKHLKADYLTALRPLISSKQKLAILFKLLENYHQPYDFDFDYMNSSGLVCSELIYKTYQQHSNLPVKPIKVAGRYTIPPSDFVKSLINQNQRKPYWQLIFFADGIPNQNTTHFKDLNELKKTLNRPTSDLILEPTSFWQHLLK